MVDFFQARIGDGAEGLFSCLGSFFRIRTVSFRRQQEKRCLVFSVLFWRIEERKFRSLHCKAGSF